MSIESLLPLVLMLLLLAVAAYVLLARWTASRRTALGISEGTVVSADDSLIRAPTLRSERLGLVGRCDHLLRVDGRYVPVEPDARGVIESEAFPGLRLNVAKMLAGDLAGVLADLEPRADK